MDFNTKEAVKVIKIFFTKKIEGTSKFTYLAEVIAQNIL